MKNLFHNCLHWLSGIFLWPITIIVIWRYYRARVDLDHLSSISMCMYIHISLFRGQMFFLARRRVYSLIFLSLCCLQEIDRYPCQYWSSVSDLFSMNDYSKHFFSFVWKFHFGNFRYFGFKYNHYNHYPIIFKYLRLDIYVLCSLRSIWSLSYETRRSIWYNTSFKR